MASNLTGLEKVINDFQVGDGLWEAAIILLTVLLAWGIYRLTMKQLERFKKPNALLIPMIGKLLLPFLLVSGLWLVQQTISGMSLSFFLPKFRLKVNVIELAVSAATVWFLLRQFFVLMFVAFQQASWVRPTMRLVNIVAWGGFLFETTGWLSTLIEEIGKIGFSYGRQDIMLGPVLHGVTIIAVTLLFTLAVSALIERKLLRSRTMPPNLQVVLSRLAKTMLITVSILFALVSIGFPLTSISVFGGALGVGLGFGLQKVMSNYVSGFIILLDRSVEIGDLVTINGYYGQITQITTRYMVLRAPDATEAIVPNETLLTSIVTNHSYSDRKTQLSTDVGVDYDADVGLAMKLMIEAAKKELRVLDDPLPSVFLKAFGENALQLQMNFWIDDPEAGKLGLISKVNLTILELFREHDINIPYPTRTVQIKAATFPNQSNGNGGGLGNDLYAG